MNTPKHTLLEKRVSRRDAIKAGGIAAVGLAFSKPIIQTIHPRPVSANLSPVGRCAVVDFTHPGTIGGTIVELLPYGTYFFNSADPRFDCSDCGPDKCLAEDLVENWRLIDDNDTVVATTSFSDVSGVTLEDGFAPKNEQVKIHVASVQFQTIIHLTSDRVVTCFKEHCEAAIHKLTSESLTIIIHQDL